MYKLLSSKVLLFAILIISFFGMNLEEGRATCPAGFTPGNTTILAGGCVVNVNFCYKCNPSNPIASEFYINSWTFIGPCSPQPSAEQIRSAFMVQRLTEFCSYQPCCEEWENNQEPCYDGLKLDIAVPICIQKFNTGSQIIYQVCETNPVYCTKRFSVCVDSQGTPQIFPVAPAISIIGGTPNCSTTEPGNPQSGRTSSCYRISTDCDPLIE